MANERRGKKKRAAVGVELEPRFLTLDEVAVYLNVRPAQVYALVRRGELPAVKVGGRGVWRVEKAALEEYVEELKRRTREWAETHPLGRRKG